MKTTAQILIENLPAILTSLGLVISALGAIYIGYLAKKSADAATIHAAEAATQAKKSLKASEHNTVKIEESTAAANSAFEVANTINQKLVDMSEAGLLNQQTDIKEIEAVEGKK